jgi:hypothetical protein
MNLRSKQLIGSNSSRNAPSWRFNLYCWNVETASPGIICIVCHQFLPYPSEHGTSYMGKQFLAEVHIAKWNEPTELEVAELTSTIIDQIALAILKRKGSRGITIVRSQKKFLFDSLILLQFTSLTASALKTGIKRLPNCPISPRYLEWRPHVRICFISHSLEQYLKPWAMMVI